VQKQYCKFIKLSNGEDIIAVTNNDCKDFKREKIIVVNDPVLIRTIKIARDSYLMESFTMQPWIKLAKERTIEIPTESIIVAVDIDDMVYEQYTTFLTEYNSDTGSEESFEEVDGSMLDYMFDEQETEEDNAEKDNNEKRGPTFH
jgi:hypothetical protein